MSEGWSKFLQVLAALMVASGFVMWAELHFRQKTPQAVVKVVTDTLYVHDTITAYKPTPVNVYVVDTVWYPVPVYGGRDTVWAEIPREAKVYEDSTYRAVVSGFRPSLDTISVFRRNVYVVTTEHVQVPAPRWGLGVQAGIGAGKDGLTPYIGVGIQYRLMDFRK